MPILLRPFPQSKHSRPVCLDIHVDPTLVTALAPTTSAAGASIATVTYTCATVGCQGDGSSVYAAFAPTGQCGTAAKREAAALVTTGAKTSANVVLRSNQVYKLCWFEAICNAALL
jgi:hypothetical protein